ncbi:MAG: endolytic transglycosylase MltG [Candidatus Moranbacteria bacterium]|nr:endolytic transglycosylase MltG [Candidatus Moranbacteria bacterium]
MDKYKKILIYAAIAISFFGLVLLLAYGNFHNSAYNQPAGSSNVEKEFKIEKNQSAEVVGERLENLGLVQSKYHFYYYLWRENLASKIQAGNYVLSPSMAVPEIVELFTAGKIKEEYKKLTIPEGFSNKKIIERLGEVAPPLKEDFSRLVNCKCLGEQECACDEFSEEFDFLKSVPAGIDMEGYLFPDTYFIYPEENASDIVEKFLSNFNKKAGESQVWEAVNSSEKTLHRIITMASIIEKEVAGYEDKRLVSGIFWKRAEDEFPLQSCATLAYALGVNKKQYSAQDIETQSPYNTYKNPGLPPGPIANPGIESIRAALNPKESDYYYFLSNPETGRTVFSKTLEQHNQNKRIHGL